MELPRVVNQPLTVECNTVLIPMWMCLGVYFSRAILESFRLCDRFGFFMFPGPSLNLLDFVMGLDFYFSRAILEPSRLCDVFGIESPFTKGNTSKPQFPPPYYQA